MYIFISLITLALIALIIVSFVNRAQERERTRRSLQRKLRLQADYLTDVVNSIEQTLPNRRIAKYINDEVILLLGRILQLETGQMPHVEKSLQNAQRRSQDFMDSKGIDGKNIDGRSLAIPSYQKDSDAQITQTQLDLDEAGKVLRHLCV